MTQTDVVHELSPSFLLANPELVEPAAPWCAWLDNAELGILLLTQPWLAGPGLRCAELERRLRRLDMPVGAIYYQRVKRAVEALEQRGQLAGRGTGRGRRFTATPRGFAALIINLQVLRADPTVDGSEFELKRALVAVCHLVMDWLAGDVGEVDAEPDTSRYLDEVTALELWGRPIITERVVADSFDVLRLIELQRLRAQSLLERAESRLEETRRAAELVLGASHVPSPDPGSGPRRQPATTVRDLVDAIRPRAAAELPELAATALVTRYRSYLDYLDQLTAVYSNRLKVIDLATVRRNLTGRSG